MKSIPRRFALTIAIAMLVISYKPSTVKAISLVQSQSHAIETSSEASSGAIESLLFAQMNLPRPPDRGAPGGRSQGASRGNCLNSEQSLTALVPTYQSTARAQEAKAVQVWGLTVSDRPSFWFYLPYQPDQIHSIEFILQNDRDETLVQIPVTSPTEPGIREIKLPDTARPLEPGKQYHWFLKVRVACQQNQPAPGTLEYVEGWIERTATDPTNRHASDQLTPQQLTALYAQHGIWYDALTLVGEQRLANPNDGAIATEWKNLLQTVGLERLASQKILP